MIDPTDSELSKAIERVLGFGWFLFLAGWGGTANYLSRIKKSQSRFSFVEWVGECAISGFAGIMTLLICYRFGIDFFLSGALVGMAGHMGGRAIFIIENLGQRYAARKLGIDLSEAHRQKNENQ